MGRHQHHIERARLERLAGALILQIACDPIDPRQRCMAPGLKGDGRNILPGLELGRGLCGPVRRSPCGNLAKRTTRSRGDMLHIEFEPCSEPRQRIAPVLRYRLGRLRQQELRSADQAERRTQAVGKPLTGLNCGDPVRGNARLCDRKRAKGKVRLFGQYFHRKDLCERLGLER